MKDSTHRILFKNIFSDFHLLLLIYYYIFISSKYAPSVNLNSSLSEFLYKHFCCFIQLFFPEAFILFFEIIFFLFFNFNLNSHVYFSLCKPLLKLLF